MILAIGADNSMPLFLRILGNIWIRLKAGVMCFKDLATISYDYHLWHALKYWTNFVYRHHGCIDDVGFDKMTIPMMVKDGVGNHYWDFCIESYELHVNCEEERHQEDELSAGVCWYGFASILARVMLGD